MEPLSPELVKRALAHDRSAWGALVRQLSPIIQRRVALTLVRKARGEPSPPTRAQVLDLTQQVFVVLLDREARVLRSWDPERGASLENFVGLVAEREAGALLRSGRRSGWAEQPTAHDQLENVQVVDDAEATVSARQQLGALWGALEARLSPRGIQLLRALYIEERSVDETARQFRMSANAVYTFRSRLRRLVGEVEQQLQGPGPLAPTNAGAES